MAKLEITNQAGEKVGEIELSDTVFASPVKEHLLWEVVVSQLAGRRGGNSSTKGRSEITGSTAKIYRQKGTGRARHGSNKAPIFRGGGIAFGPKPRSYTKATPKKVKRGGLISAISLRAKEKKLVVIEDLKLDEIKTKQVVAMFEQLGIKNGLIVEEGTNLELVKSARNLAHSKWIAPEGLNVYDILRYDTLVMTAPVAKKIEERLLP